jgi:hypothetical protein
MAIGFWHERRFTAVDLLAIGALEEFRRSIEGKAWIIRRFDDPVTSELVFQWRYAGRGDFCLQSGLEQAEE